MRKIFKKVKIALFQVSPIVIPNPLGPGATFETLLNKIIDFLFWVGMAVAPVMFIVAGFLYVTSAGSPQKVESAKKMMIYAVIGLAVLLLAKGLVEVLKSVIGVPITQ